MIKLTHGDCLDKLKEFEDNSIDSIVTDPPYGLSFMGKKWDYDVPSQEIFAECLRVIKPGGHILAFAGSRTYHRMAVRIEDAGFEIRDQIMWIYGSGFPKSHNIGKAVDKKNGQHKIELKFVEWYRTVGISAKETNKIIGTTDTGSHYLRLDQPYLPTKEFWKQLKPHIKIEIPKWVDELIERNEAEREILEKKRVQRNRISWNGGGMIGVGEQNFDTTAPATDLAKKWEGWGTALKPAHEPIVMARKPFKGTVVNNVLEWGTGGINIEESRIQYKDVNDIDRRIGKNVTYGEVKQKTKFRQIKYKKICGTKEGRFPANIILDKEAGKILDKQSGILKSGNLNAGHKRGVGTGNSYTGGGGIIDRNYGGDKGGASRFFYCPKTSKKDRNEGCNGLEEKVSTKQFMDGMDNVIHSDGSVRKNAPILNKNSHPTVKPTDLMLYLIRLVTPKGGTTLDLFMGSGSTGKAAIRGGFDFIGIEREIEYMNIAQERIKYEQEQVKKLNAQKRLF